MSSDKGQFEQGYQPPISYQNDPGLEQNLPKYHAPLHKELPTPDGGKQLYKAAGKLTDRKVLLTGGDSGIGRAIAILYAMEGADLYIAYLPVEEDDAQETRKEVEACGRKCWLHAIDLTSKENCKVVAEKARKEMGQVNILVNNHAFQYAVDTIEELSEEQWIKTFDTNIHPFFYLSKYLVPHMKAGDTILNNASINAYVGRPDLLDYTSTKGAIVSFTRGLANQLVKRQIRVNAVAPGPVWTPLIPATMHKPQQENFTAPIGRPSQPSEVATVFVFLASMDASSITGQVVHVNGGGFVTS